MIVEATAAFSDDVIAMAILKLFRVLRLNRTLAERMMDIFTNSVIRLRSGPNDLSPMHDDQLQRTTTIDLYMTIKSLDMLKSLASNANLARIIRKIKLTAHDFTSRMVNQQTFERQLYERWTGTGPQNCSRRCQERGHGAEWMARKLTYEYDYYRRYLAEHLQIINNGKFERTVAEAVPKLKDLTIIIFRREAQWGKLPSHGYTGIDKPSKITVPPQAVRNSDKAALAHPIHWQGFLRLAAAAGAHSKVDTLVLEGMAPELSMVPCNELALGAILFGKVAHIDIECARDRRPDPVRHEMERDGVPKSRNAIGRNGTAAEIEAWKTVLTSSPAIESFQLSTGRATYQQGGTMATTTSCKLVNLILSSCAPTSMNELHLQDVDADLILYQQFARSHCENVKLACLQHVRLYSEDYSRWSTEWQEYRLATQEGQEREDLLTLMPSLKAGVIVQRRRQDGEQGFDTDRTYFGTDAAKLEASDCMIIGRKCIYLAEHDEETRGR